MFRLDKTKVSWQEILRKGASGVVFPYKEDPTDNKWVVKCMSIETFDDFLLLIQEIVLGFNLDHPNILPIRGFYVEEKENLGEREFEVYVKLERMKSSLDQVIRQH